MKYFHFVLYLYSLYVYNAIAFIIGMQSLALCRSITSNQVHGFRSMVALRNVGWNQGAQLKDAIHSSVRLPSQFPPPLFWRAPPESSTSMRGLFLFFFLFFKRCCLHHKELLQTAVNNRMTKCRYLFISPSDLAFVSYVPRVPGYLLFVVIQKKARISRMEGSDYHYICWTQ